MKEVKRAHVFISGRVQGVYFRDSTRAEALARGVTGWVRNLPDGRVEGVFEGDCRAVDGLVSWCRQGPPGAFVTHLEVQLETPSGEYSTLRVQ